MVTNVNGRFSGIEREREKYCFNGMRAVFDRIVCSSELNIANTGATPITLVDDLKITGDRFTVNENGCRAKTLAVGDSCLVKISALGLINGVQQSGALRMSAASGDSLVVPLTLDFIAPQAAYVPPIVAGADLKRSRAPDKRAFLRTARLGTAATSSLPARRLPAEYLVRQPSPTTGDGLFSYPTFLDRVITTDRVISCVLEDMIDTELPGDSVICIVDRPVYGAHGGNILLPQGSRIVGSYQSLANVGVKRLPVAWKRFIRPDGASVTLSAPSAALDLMGRAGIPAKVDNRWLARYGAAFASAMLNTSIAFATAPSRGQSNSITGSINGSNIQNPVDQARTTAAQSLGAITQQLLAEGISLKPVARVQAGTRLIIRPSVDLIFPVPRRLRGDPRWGQIALAPSALGDVRAALVATGAAATRSSTQPKQAQPAPAPKIAPVVVENLPPDTVDPFSN